MWKRLKSAALLTPLVLSGCALIPIEIPLRLYNTANGELLPASYVWTGGTGKIAMTDARGQKCNGEYVTQSVGSMGYGQSYGSVMRAGRIGTRTSSGTYQNQATSAPGTAILRCPDGNVIQCEYVANMGNTGSGTCTDNRGSNYRMMW